MKATLAAFLALLLPAAASARQPPPARPDTVVRIAPLQVRALLADEISRTPGAAAILSADAIRALRPFTLHDALVHVAGVRTIDDDLLGRRAGIGIRGAPPRRSRKTLLLEDGSPINSSTYLDPSAHYTPPTERLERVEVLKGAGQIVHGPLNNHGIINFRNRRATRQPHTALELATGDHATFRRHLLHSRTVGATGIVLSYTGLDTDGVFDVERHRFDDAYASVALDMGRRQRLESSVTWHRERSRGYDEANLTPAQFALHPRSKRALDEGREFNSFSVNYLKGDLAWEAGLGADSRLSARAFATRLDRPRLQTRGIAPTAGGVMEGRDRLYRTVGADTRLALPFARAGSIRSVAVGVRVERHWFDYARPVGRPGEVLDDRDRGERYARAGQDCYTRDGRFTTFTAAAGSAFAQVPVDLGRVLVTPGVRLESYTQSRHVVFWPGSDDDGIRERDAHTLVLPGVSVLYDASDAWQVYAGVHRGFAPATARSEEFPLIPETGINSQLGLRSSPSSQVGFDVALFYNVIRNTLIRDDVDRFGEALFVNTASSRVRGVDVAAVLRSAAGYAGISGFAELAYNLTSARFTGGQLHGNRVPEVPLHAGAATLGLERAGTWRGSLTASHMAGFHSDKENTVELAADAGWVPAHTLYSARGELVVRRSPEASLWLQARNLADRLYISDVQDGLRPGAPRTLSAGVTVSF